MQQALRGTVSDVRKGSHEMHIGIAEIVAGNNDLSSRTEQQAASLAQTAASMEQLTATVGKTPITHDRRRNWQKMPRQRRRRAVFRSVP